MHALCMNGTLKRSPEPSNTEWLSPDEREWSIATGRTAAASIAALARALETSSIPPPPSA